MTKISFPYGKTKLNYNFSDEELIGVLTSSIEGHKPKNTEDELVKKHWKTLLEV